MTKFIVGHQYEDHVLCMVVVPLKSCAYAATLTLHLQSRSSTYLCYPNSAVTFYAAMLRGQME